MKNMTNQTLFEQDGIIKQGGYQTMGRWISGACRAIWGMFWVILAGFMVVLPASGALTITNGIATNITASNAVLFASLTATNSTNTTLTCYYGTGNGGTNVSFWQYSNRWGIAVCLTNVSITTTNILSGRTYYYYRWKAVGTNTAWAANSAVFTTLSQAVTSWPTVGTNAITQMILTNGLWQTPSRTLVISANALATGTPVYVESDPIYTNWLATNTYVHSNSGNWAGTWQTYGPSYFRDWANTTNKSVDIPGYGITDAWTKVESDARFGTTGSVALLQEATNALNGRLGIAETSKVDYINATYTATVALAASAVQIETDSIATNLIYITSNAYVAADAVLTNAITVSSNHFASTKVTTNTIVAQNVVYNITNAAQAGYILEFNPANSTAWFVAKSSAGTYDHTALTNQDGNTNFLHVSQILHDAIETNLLAFHGGTNISIREDGTNIYWDSTYSDATILAATGALNIAVVNLNAATNALNTAVGNLQTATGSQNTAIGNLNTSTGALNTTLNGHITADEVTNPAQLTAIGFVTNPLSANLDVNNKELTNVAAITFGGDRQTAWPVATTSGTNWSKYVALQDVDFATKGATNIGVGSMASLQITGGSPTTGSVWIATNTLGQGTLVTKTVFNKLVLEVNGSTNTQNLVVTGVGFRPKGCTVFALAQFITKGISHGSVGSDGEENCILMTGEGVGTSSSGNCARVAPGSTGGLANYLNHTSWDADGATFARTKDAGIITNDIQYVFTFFR